MDIFTDPQPETYVKWKKFTMPHDSGSMTAIAMSSRSASIFVALYTILIIGIFMVAWNLLISFVFLIFTPKEMNRTSYVAAVAAWNANDPMHATLLISQHTLHILGGLGRRKKHGGDNYRREFNGRVLMFDLAILLVAAGTTAGSLTMGLLFPELLVIGSVAPVNPNIPMFPSWEAVEGSTQTQQQALEYFSMGALRAFGSIEGSEVTIRKLVNVKIDNITEYNNERRYQIPYNYEVTGVDMGLQHFAELKLTVTGECFFKDGWYDGPSKRGGEIWEMYTMWKDTPDTGISTKKNGYQVIPAAAPSAMFLVADTQKNRNQWTGTSYYTILPTTANKWSFTDSLDPWYATEPVGPNDKPLLPYTYKVKKSRPALMCRQTDEWSYQGWKGKPADLYDSTSSNRAPLTFPSAIEQILRGSLASPMAVTLGRNLSPGALKSATRVLPDVYGIDTKHSSARADIERVILASFVATRDIFKDSAMAGHYFGSDNEAHPDVLRGPDGMKVDGTGDFVLRSSAVSTLRFGYFVAVPCILVGLILLTSVFKLGREIKIAGAYDGQAYPEKWGRWNRFVMFVLGLPAAQLYRMVDQMLANVGVTDPIPADQANWRKQTSAFPRVVDTTKNSNELVLPQLQVVEVGDAPTVDHRLIFGVGKGIKLTKNDTSPDWKRLQQQENAIKQPTPPNSPPANSQQPSTSSQEGNESKTPLAGAAEVGPADDK